MSQKPNSTPMSENEKAALRTIGKFFLLFFGTKLALYFILRAIVGATSDDE